MPAERRRIFRAALSVMLLIAGCMLAISIDRGAHVHTTPEVSATLLDEPEFLIRFGRNRLLISGTTASNAHELGITDLVSDQFANSETRTEFKPGLMLPPDWETVSTRLLYLVAATDSAEASIDAQGVAIHGVTSDNTAFQNRLDFLQSALPNDDPVNASIIVISSSTSLGELCEQNFASFSDQAMEFRQSSTELRQSSFPLLDRLVEFSYECRERQIAITGHSDATGSESWNRQLSRRRAQAVADYLVAAGVSAERLIVEGVGSAQPIADNDTVHGRERNRRIVLELR